MSTLLKVNEVQGAAPQPPARNRQRSDSRLAWLLVSPLVLLILLLMAYPLVRILWTSFQRSTFIHPQSEFIGVRNYQDLIESSTFWRVLSQSAYWTIGTVVLQTVVGISVALLLTQRFRGRSLLRVLVIVPWAMPGVLAAILWKFMYDPYLGMVNLVGHTLHLWEGAQAPLADQKLVMPALIIAAVWKGTPFSILMYLAALQSRSQDVMEAAIVDGANAWQTFRAVTLPSLKPVIQTTVLLTTIWTFNYFDLIFVMTGGGPSGSSEIAPTFIYHLAFVEVDYGKSGAFAVLSMLVMGAMAIVYMRQLSRSKGAAQ